MGTTSGKVNSVIHNLGELKKICFEELSHLVENCRWLTTLVIAEIAGIAAYRDLLKANSLSLLFAIIVLILAITISSFMVSILLSRNAKKNISTLINEALNEITIIDNNPKTSSYEGDLMVDNIQISLEIKISKQPKASRLLEMIGIVLFILGSILSILILFFSEILKLFGL